MSEGVRNIEIVHTHSTRRYSTPRTLGPTGRIAGSIRALSSRSAHFSLVKHGRRSPARRNARRILFASVSLPGRQRHTHIDLQTTGCAPSTTSRCTAPTHDASLGRRAAHVPRGVAVRAAHIDRNLSYAAHNAPPHTRPRSYGAAGAHHTCISRAHRIRSSHPASPPGFIPTGRIHRATLLAHHSPRGFHAPIPSSKPHANHPDPTTITSTPRTDCRAAPTGATCTTSSGGWRGHTPPTNPSGTRGRPTGERRAATPPPPKEAASAAKAAVARVRRRSRRQERGRPPARSGGDGGGATKGRAEPAQGGAAAAPLPPRLIRGVVPMGCAAARSARCSGA